MPDKEFINLSEAIQAGLDKAFMEMLKMKAALGQNVIIADKNGSPIELPAKDVLKNFS